MSSQTTSSPSAHTLYCQNFLTLAGKEELLSIWHKTLFIDSSASDQSPSPKAYQVMANKFAQEGLDYETIWSDVSQKYSA